MKKSVLSFLTVASVFYLVSCKKGDTGTPGATGVPGPALSGSMSGYTTLFDQYGTRFYTNLSGIKVSIEGSSRFALTDSTGRWQIDSLSTGVYSLNFSKTSFGDFKLQSTQFVGGGNLDVKNIPLSAIPVYQIGSNLAPKDSVAIIPQTTDTVAKGIAVAGTFTSADTKSRSAVLFISKSASVTSDPATYLLAVVPKNPFPVDKKNPNGTNFAIFISADELHNAGFAKGETVYIKAYSAANGFNSASTYQDTKTGRVVYNALGNASSTVPKQLSY